MNKFFSKLDMANQLTQYAFDLVAYLTIVIDSFQQRKIVQRFWIIYGRILRQNTFLQYQIQLNYIFKFFEYFIVFNVSFFYVLAQVFQNFGSFKVEKYPIFWAYLLQIEICNIRLFYYLFFLELNRIDLKTIEHKLKENHESFEVQMNIDTILKWTQEYYQQIHDMSECVNSTFGWSNLMTIESIFLFVLTELNYSYYDNYVISYEQNFYVIAHLIFVFHTVLHLFYIFDAAAQCTFVVNLMSK